ncbi:zinc finger protein 578-like [Hylaeus anthracinus]|uniref:zinc finger protein 578-like n=1 Tax=Hylaeus anthracinus TaxID=313031 RepID=UPI0023B8B8C6|nr:zinc finger protein 578-like [Hylaeus anthracinus]
MRYFMSRVTRDRRRSRGQGRFACDNCDRRYHQMKNLRRHVINECVESQYPAVSAFKHTCATCGKTYKHKHHLKRHHDFECGIDPKFKCAFCPHRTRVRLQLVELDGADVAIDVEGHLVHQASTIHDDEGRAGDRSSLGPQEVPLHGLQSNILVDGLHGPSPYIRV